MPLSTFPATPNPFGVGTQRRLTDPGLAAIPFAAILIGPPVGSLVLRFRRGTALERRQIGWLAMACGLVVLAVASMFVTSPNLIRNGELSPLSAFVNAFCFAAIPVAIGIAIVRHQLYDIDRIVKRTLVYALVSATLGVVYALAVLGLSTPFTVILPSAGDTLTTAASTLLVAALFRPVRNRAQAVVDRRFDRERHEAAGMVEAFSGRMRADVELDGIIGDLLGAAGWVVHPASSACWLRARESPGQALVGSARGH